MIARSSGQPVSFGWDLDLFSLIGRMLVRGDKEMVMKIRLAAGALAALGLPLLTSAPAGADTPMATGSIGWAHAFSSHPAFDVNIQLLAECTAGAVATASTSGATGQNFVAFGNGTTTCGVNATGAASAEVSGRNFTLDGLRHFGGPKIKISRFTVSCNTTASGTSARVQITGMSGMRVPNPVPPNHTVTVPGARAGDPPVARIVFNETIPGTAGSMTVNLMHVRLFPDGIALANGEVVVGSVHCAH
jgi:hypothetical protein